MLVHNCKQSSKMVNCALNGKQCIVLSAAIYLCKNHQVFQIADNTFPAETPQPSMFSCIIEISTNS